MNLSDQRVLITGGAGFIGSHLADRLQHNGTEVHVIDDFSTGREEWVPSGATVHERDLSSEEMPKNVLDDIDVIFHLAAQSNANDPDPRNQFETNTAATHRLLESANEAGVDRFVFASSSTVYGEAPRPTPEDHAPLEPISVYGASKLAEEGLVSTYAHSHDLTAWIFRFANVVGSRLRGAVIPDFIEKLHDDPSTLTILGDGRQEKSYLHVSDCVSGMVHAIENTDGSDLTAPYSFNLGTRTTTAVNTIADVVCEELGVDPSYEYTGGERGWTGDVPKMRLSIEKVSDRGWSPEHESTEAVRRATRELLTEL